jgi:hypothetical protein
MKVDYEALVDECLVTSAMIDKSLEERPDEEELKELQEFLADRFEVILFLGERR